MDTNSLVLCLVCLIIYALKDFIIRTYKCYKINVPTVPGYPILGVIPKLLGNSQEGKIKNKSFFFNFLKFKCLNWNKLFL